MSANVHTLDDFNALPYQAFLPLNHPQDSYLLFECDHEQGTMDIMVISGHRAEKMMDAHSRIMGQQDALELLQRARREAFVLEIVESPDHRFDVVPEVLNALGAW